MVGRRRAGGIEVDDKGPAEIRAGQMADEIAAQQRTTVDRWERCDAISDHFAVVPRVVRTDAAEAFFDQ